MIIANEDVLAEGADFGVAIPAYSLKANGNRLLIYSIMSCSSVESTFRFLLNGQGTPIITTKSTMYLIIEAMRTSATTATCIVNLVRDSFVPLSTFSYLTGLDFTASQEISIEVGSLITIVSVAIQLM